MKRITLIAIPLLFFLLAALLSYFHTSSEQPVATEEEMLDRSSRRKRSAVAAAIDMTSVLGRMESRMYAQYPAPPREMNWSGSGYPDVVYTMKWAKIAPEEMFAWLINQNQDALEQAHILFETWGKVANSTALDAALRLPDAKLRARALFTTLEILYQTQPERAKSIMFENAELFPDSMAGSLYYDAGAENTAWELLLALPEGYEKTHLQMKLLSLYAEKLGNQWNQASDAQRKDWVAAGLRSLTNETEYYSGLDELQRQRAEETGNPDDAESFISDHGEAWAETDLVAAMNWTQTYVKGERKVEAVKKLFYQNVQKNYGGTLSVWQQLPESYLKKEIAEEILHGIPDERKAEAKIFLQQE